MWPLVDQTAFVTHLWQSHYLNVATHSHTATKELNTNTKNIYYNKVENNLNHLFLSFPLGDQAAWGNYSMQAVWIQAVRVLETIV